jgi:LysM repeat protein
MSVSSARILLVRLLILVLVLASILLLSSARVDAAQPLTTVEYRVGSGDTLWGIAASVTQPGGDTRTTVQAIREINDLESTTIRPGQVIDVPAA